MKNAILKLIAKTIIRKYKPIVIGITGSVGKTSTKEAIYTVVKQKYQTFRSLRNLNTESGVPISVMAIGDISESKWAWRFQVIKRTFSVLMGRIEYPQVLILEYGADKPGDIEYLLSIVRPDIAVLTAVAPTHLEQFGSVEAVRQEKMKLLESVEDLRKRIYNADLVEFADGVSYGVIRDAKILATDIVHNIDSVTHAGSTLFKIHSEGSVVPCELVGVLGDASVSCALAAIAVGRTMGMNIVDSVRGLKEFHGKPGHMRVLEGIKHTTIIDDSYNSSPVAARHAIDTVAGLEGFSRKWAVLGDMLELGAQSVQYHQEIGEYVARYCHPGSARLAEVSAERVEGFPKRIDYLVTVGERARDIARGAREAFMDPDHVFDFEDTLSAGKFIQDRIKQGDLILVKGSQGMKMERVVRELMAEPQRADELLVRRSFGV